MNNNNCPVCGNKNNKNEDKCPICDWDNHPVIGCSDKADLRLLNIELELARVHWQNIQLNQKIQNEVINSLPNETRISVIHMKQLSPEMTEGRLTRWMISDGELVTAGSLICEVETDKATMEFEAEFSGYILPMVKGGALLKVGGIIGIISNCPVILSS